MTCFICGSKLTASSGLSVIKNTEDKENAYFLIRILLDLSPSDFPDKLIFAGGTSPRTCWATCSKCKELVNVAKSNYGELVNVAKKVAGSQKKVLEVVKKSQGKKLYLPGFEDDRHFEKCVELVTQRNSEGKRFAFPDLKTVCSLLTYTYNQERIQDDERTLDHIDDHDDPICLEPEIEEVSSQTGEITSCAQVKTSFQQVEQPDSDEKETRELPETRDPTPPQISAQNTATEPYKPPKRPEDLALAGIEMEFGKYHCPSCDYETGKKAYLRRHFRTKHLRVRYRCAWPDCGKKWATQRAFEDHLDTHYGTPRYKCSQCSETFYFAHKYNYHRQLVPGTAGSERKEYVCRTLNPEKIPKKVKKRTNSESFACDECEKTFRQKQSLENHKKTRHLGMPPRKRNSELVMCSKCGESVSSTHLYAHNISKHTERKYSCTECSSKFPFNDRLKDHMRRKHGIGDSVKFRCPVPLCRKFCRSQQDLSTHTEEVHGHDNSKPGAFMCQFCDKCFFMMCQLRKHEKVHENATNNS